VALANGSEKIPVLVGSWTPEQEAKILATLDPLANMATADPVALDALIREVNTGCEELAEMLADLWDEVQADALADATPPPPVDEDTAPELQIDAVTQPGDLWILGNHRLLCGDSSDPRDVMAATGGSQWDVVVLDPPYDAPEAVWSRWIHDPSIVFGQAKHLRMIPERLWRFERVIVKQYRHRSATVQIDHRHAFVAQVGSVKHLPHTSETFPSVIQQENETEHNHAKPVGLLVEHLTKWTPQWEIVIDPYAGAGSTIMAAEHIGRRCISIELAPEWCDVIVKRWELATKKTAQRVANSEVAAYNAGVAGAVTPAGPKHPRSVKETERV